MAKWNIGIPREDKTKEKISLSLKILKGSKEVNCYYCQKPIWKTPHQLKRAKRYFCSPKHQRLGLQGKEAWQWKEENASYKALHQWMNIHFGKPHICDHCGSKEKKVYDWANKFPFKYQRIREDWMRLCRKCHIKYDRMYGLNTREGEFEIRHKVPFRRN